MQIDFTGSPSVSYTHNIDLISASHTTALNVSSELPLSIFRNGLSGLESIVRYLKETIGLRFCEIAQLLNRDSRTVWDAYHASETKQNEFSADRSGLHIPSSLFADRTLSVLESIVVYLKETLQLRNCKIAMLLNKDARTIWTVYHRANKKRKNVA